MSAMERLRQVLSRAFTDDLRAAIDALDAQEKALAAETERANGLAARCVELEREQGNAINTILTVTRAWDADVETAEHNQSVACAVVFDIYLRGVRCYSCGEHLGSDDDKVRAHVVSCEKSPSVRRVVELERERDSWRAQRDEVHAEMEEQTRQKREERQAKLDAMRERDEARAAAADREGLAVQLEAARETIEYSIGLRKKAEADAARLREALEKVLCSPEHGQGAPCPCRRCNIARAALASTPSAVTREQAERWLSEGPEEPGGMMAVKP